MILSLPKLCIGNSTLNFLANKFDQKEEEGTHCLSDQGPKPTHSKKEDFWRVYWLKKKITFIWNFQINQAYALKSFFVFLFDQKEDWQRWRLRADIWCLHSQISMKTENKFSQHSISKL